MKLPPQDILLVEGHDDSREMVRWYLTQIGYQVRASSTCAASLSQVSVRRFNLYLLGDDCLDGTALDLCQQIRALDADTPILFCSTRAFPADHERGMRAGAQAYLTKPLEWDELEQTIVQLIGEVRAVATARALGAREGRRARHRLGAPGFDSSSQSVVLRPTRKWL